MGVPGSGGVSEWEFPVCYHSRAPRHAVGSPSKPERKGDAVTESRRSRGSHDCRVDTALPPRSLASSAAITGYSRGTHGVPTDMVLPGKLDGMAKLQRLLLSGPPR